MLPAGVAQSACTTTDQASALSVRIPQVVGTQHPAWRATDLLASSPAWSCGYSSGLIHLHLYVRHEQAADTGSHHPDLADLPDHPVPSEDAGDSSSALPQDADNRPASFTSSVWRSLKRPDSSNSHAQPVSADSLPELPDAAAHACCSAVALPGELVAAWSVDLASLKPLAATWKDLASMNCSYPPATLLLELHTGIYTLPGMLPDATSSSNGEVAVPTPGGSAQPAPGEVVLPALPSCSPLQAVLTPATAVPVACAVHQVHAGACVQPLHACLPLRQP